jgi:hypothetical protein
MRPEYSKESRLAVPCLRRTEKAKIRDTANLSFRKILFLCKVL